MPTLCRGISHFRHIRSSLWVLLHVVFCGWAVSAYLQPLLLHHSGFSMANSTPRFLPHPSYIMTFPISFPPALWVLVPQFVRGESRSVSLQSLSLWSWPAPIESSSLDPAPTSRPICCAWMSWEIGQGSVEHGLLLSFFTTGYGERQTCK